jgi:hypothetical protein
MTIVSWSAQVAGADFVITGNAKHFPKLHNNTRIVSPRQFVTLLLPGAE